MVQPMMFYCWLKNKIQILACCSIKVSFKWPCRTSQDLINYNCLLQSSFNMSPNSNQFRTMHTNSYEKKITENKPRHTSLSPFPVVARFNPNPAQNQLHKLQMDPKTHPHRPLWLPLHSLKNSPLFCWNTNIQNPTTSSSTKQSSQQTHIKATASSLSVSLFPIM